MKARLLLAVAGLVLPTMAGSQALENDCVRERVEALTPAELRGWSGYRPDDMKLRFASMRTRNQWRAIVDSLRRIYLVGNAGPPASLAGLTAPQRSELEAQVKRLADELAEGEVDSEARDLGKITITRFELRFTSAFDGGPKYVLFRDGQGDSIVVTPGMNENTRRSMCWFALAATDLATFFGDPGRQALARAFSARVTRWDNFFRKGYAMLPHELFINGLTPREELEPPRWQLIVMHPSAGTQMTQREGSWALNSFQRRDVLVLEPLGFLFYRRSRNGYVGTSAVMTFPVSGKSGVGISGHLGGLGKVSYIFNAPRNNGTRGGAVMVSTDLYRYLGQRRDELEKLKAADLAGCLSKPERCVKRTEENKE